MSDADEPLLRRHVVVRQADGRAIAGAMVEVVQSSVPVPEVGRLTDAEGRLVLHLPQGRYKLRAYTPDGFSGEVQIDEDNNAIVEIEVGKIA